MGLQVIAGNKPVIYLHKKLGFKIEGLMKNSDGYILCHSCLL